VPFTVIIPRDRQDRGLGDKLYVEREGILAWAVEGATRWYSGGLVRPEEVEQSGGAWRREMDRVAAFLEECCHRGGGMVRAGKLYQRYKEWAEANGERPMSGRAFAERLREAGIQKTVNRDAMFYLDVFLRSAQRGMRPGNGKKLVAHSGGPYMRPSAAGSQSEVASPDRGRRRKKFMQATEIGKIRYGQVYRLQVEPRIGDHRDHEAVRFAKSCRVKKNPVEQTENGRCRADSGGENGDRHGCKCGSFPEASNGVL
jgi:phage/plasmid-associated DNA primase